MNRPQKHYGLFPHAFTLIELLVVIAVIAILASMIFPVTGAMKKRATRVRAQAELAQVEAAIERYKAKHGFYPPDHPGNPVINQLYFELLGTTNWGAGVNKWYQTLDGSAQTNYVGLTNTFGPNVEGVVNSSMAGGGDDGPVATAFLTGLKPTQVGELLPGVKLLACSVPWPYDPATPDYPTTKSGLNPWRYVSSSPTNNPASYDLWVDILIAGETNRICNWSKQPLIVGAP
jgi:prepilin-type N-terminal cleavage/methylation domain-containing protein